MILLLIVILLGAKLVHKAILLIWWPSHSLYPSLIIAWIWLYLMLSLPLTTFVEEVENIVWNFFLFIIFFCWLKSYCFIPYIGICLKMGIDFKSDVLFFAVDSSRDRNFLRVQLWPKVYWKLLVCLEKVSKKLKTDNDSCSCEDRLPLCHGRSSVFLATWSLADWAMGTRTIMLPFAKREATTWAVMLSEWNLILIFAIFTLIFYLEHSIIC